MLKLGVKCTSSSNQLTYVRFLSFLLLFVVDCTLLALHQEPVVKKVPLPVYVSYFLNAIGKQGRIVRWRQPASLVVGKKKSLIASAIHIPNHNISNHKKEWQIFFGYFHTKEYLISGLQKKRVGCGALLN